MLHSKKTRGWTTMREVTREGIYDFEGLNAAHKIALHRLLDFAERMGLGLICDMDNPLACLTCGDELWSDMVKLTSDDASRVLEFVCALNEETRRPHSLADLERRVTAIEEQLELRAGAKDAAVPAQSQVGAHRDTERFQKLCQAVYRLNGRLEGHYELASPSDAGLTLMEATYYPSKIVDTEAHTYTLPTEFRELERIIEKHQVDFQGKAHMVMSSNNSIPILLYIEQGRLLPELVEMAHAAGGGLEIGDRDENRLLKLTYRRRQGLKANTLPEVCQDIPETPPYYISPWHDGNDYHFMMPYGYDKLIAMLERDRTL